VPRKNNNTSNLKLRDPEIRAKGVSARLRKLPGKRGNYAVNVDFPGFSPGPGGKELPKERHAKTALAIARTEAAVGRVFDFLDRLIAAGNGALEKYEHGAPLKADDMDMVKEARAVALKFMDKTVPDVLSNATPTQQPVQILINAPLQRLAPPPPPPAQITESEPHGPREATHGTDDTVH
jgi:hypothetical protein